METSILAVCRRCKELCSCSPYSREDLVSKAGTLFNDSAAYIFRGNYTSVPYDAVKIFLCRECAGELKK